MSATGGKGTRRDRLLPNQAGAGSVSYGVTTWTDRAGISSRFVFGCLQLFRFGWLELVP
ncbi:hypothetical protein [Kribbella sp.]|uniref:hypothetical protein n=1 Tax=Kribbella sp. TaxID=1871183 RepID=UPI002D6C10FB|nr:hypothetical protein [Kribbella sp.]HZX06778.1 hypothetical protein [Kribbella sp.]